MGIDASILFKTNMTTEEMENDCDLYLSKHEVIFEDGANGLYDDERDETHCVDVPYRHYSEHYARGPWPLICSILMQLLQHPKVEKVWYGGDGYVYECTIESVLKTSEFYMLNGERPYRDRDYKIR